MRNGRTLAVVAFVQQVALSTLLAACSAGGPSDREVEDALRARMVQPFVGKRDGMSVDAIDEIHCRAIEDGRKYACKLELEVSAPMAGTAKATGELRLVERDGRWAYDQNEVFRLDVIPR